MKFHNGDVCTIERTGGPVDGTFVEVIGAANVSGIIDIYVVKRTDGQLFEGADEHNSKWQAFTVSNACLDKAKWSGE